MQKTISTIAVCGAGTMGSGIAQVAAQAGFATVLYDLNETVLEKAKASIEKSLSFLVAKEKITAEEKEAIFHRIHFTQHINDCVADLCLEAIVEKLAIKVSLFHQLAAINTSETILATNTSSLSVTHIAEQISHPERVVGLHFFNPAPVMKLVEVVGTKFTDASLLPKMVALVKQMGKVPAVCKDAPGFIVNRVARPFYIEALRLVEEGKADYATIDAMMTNAGFKMGPFALMDLIGNDINYAVSCSVYEQLNKPERLKPSYLQEENVKAGKLGKKTGEGFYNYPKAEN